MYKHDSNNIQCKFNNMFATGFGNRPHSTGCDSIIGPGKKRMKLHCHVTSDTNFFLT